MFRISMSWLGILLAAVALAFSGNAFCQQTELPRAQLLIDAIADLGQGRYRVSGEALDAQGRPACALVLASGKCTFTCGPGSLKCEGGTSSLPVGSFDLSGLPAGADGSIVIQVFVQGHISHAEKRFPSPGQVARWGVFNNVCCVSGGGRFSATIGGVTKGSRLAACGAGSAAPTWEGYAPIVAGARQLTARYVSPCGNLTYPLNVNFDPGACYVLFHNSAQRPFVLVSPTDCQNPQ